MTGAPAPALFTDLYEVAMAAVYHAEAMTGRAVFEAFYRRLPAQRNYIVAAGLAPVLEYLEQLRFDAGDLAYLAGLRRWPDGFLDTLGELRFSGDVWAVPEGTLVFPHEPLLQIDAPILQAQLVETYVLNQLHVHSVIASKAARVVDAARGRPVIDFGSRRAHGADAALALARASWLAGAAGTSNLLAGRRLGIPVFGTMAHSFVQAFDDELAAFRTFMRHNPGTTLLVDTYDTLSGVERVIELARRLGPEFDVRAIRLDSGDLGALARAARARLDAAGLGSVGIFASSGLDEHEIGALLDAGAPIDGFGVGSALAVAADAPSLDLAYKLVEYEGRGRTKLSSAKVLYPCRKQVFRSVEQGRLAGDLIGRAGERPGGTPLLVPVMKNGRRLETPALEAIRRHAQRERALLPERLGALERARPGYPVSVTPALQAALDELRARY